MYCGSHDSSVTELPPNHKPSKMIMLICFCYSERMTNPFKLPNHVLLIPSGEVKSSQSVDPLGKFVLIDHAETEHGNLSNVVFMVDRIFSYNSRDYASDGVFLLDVTDMPGFNGLYKKAAE